MNSENSKQVAGSHTPGPWKVGESADNGLPCVDGIDQKDGSLFEICEVWGEERDISITEMSIANARRIVACVNACDGIPTEKLEGRTIAEYVSDEAYLQGMQPSGDGLSVGLSGLACQMLASSFAGQFVGSRAVNYLEVHMENPEIGEFNVTIQRKEGKTPGQMKAEVEQQRDHLATKVADTELALFAENQKRQDVERQRDVLLAALKRIINACDECATDDDKSIVDLFTEEMESDARSAIVAADLGDRVQVPAELVGGGE